MNIGSLQEYLSTQTINSAMVNRSGSIVTENQDVSFSEILSEACRKGTGVNDMFQAAFPKNGVQTKVGNCDVPWESWDRNDFPVWKYFEKESRADCLNNWKGVGPEPPQWDSRVQKGLSQIKYGEMVILMPENLQKKMESDPDFAEDVLKRVQKWKEDYDREDNAIAASLGYDPELNQLSKSYCIQLDEDGNVGDHIVIGGGLDDPHSKEEKVRIGSDDDKLIVKKTGRKETYLAENTAMMTESNSIDFESVAPILMEYRMKKK